LPTRGVLRDWHDRASIRTAPRRTVGPLDFDQESGLCFPLELTPWAAHPHVAGLGPNIQRSALAHQLFLYLDFTDALEHEAVNRTVRRIATGASGLNCDTEYRMDAYKIYCDEAYHSYFSADLSLQIQQATGFRPQSAAKHPALTLFEAGQQTCSPEIRPWYELLFVTVSETLVSGSLEKIPKSPTVTKAVREVVRDHLHDEREHHSFFAQFFPIAWRQIPRTVQNQLGPMLPRFITGFLAPHLQGIRDFLTLYLTTAEVEQVLEESYPVSVLPSAARSASSATRALFKQAGLFESEAIYEAFCEQGLERASSPKKLKDAGYQAASESRVISPG